MLAVVIRLSYAVSRPRYPVATVKPTSEDATMTAEDAKGSHRRRCDDAFPDARRVRSPAFSDSPGPRRDYGRRASRGGVGRIASRDRGHPSVARPQAVKKAGRSRRGQLGTPGRNVSRPRSLAAGLERAVPPIVPHEEQFRLTDYEATAPGRRGSSLPTSSAARVGSLSSSNPDPRIDSAPPPRGARAFRGSYLGS